MVAATCRGNVARGVEGGGGGGEWSRDAFGERA